MTTTALDITADLIDVRDITARCEDLEEATDGLPEAEERCYLAAILDDIRDTGGDEQWRGDWYPVTLVRDSYFTNYARQMLEDCGTIPKDLPAWVEIDWEATARNVQVDYTSVEIDGVTYWAR